MAKNKKRPLWQRIRLKYKLSFINENSLEEVFSFRFSIFRGILLVGLFALVLIVLTSIVILNTPIRNYLPDYLDADIRNEMLLNYLKADSLQREVDRQSLYLDNISSIIRGEVEVDSIPQIDSIYSVSDLALDPSEESKSFIAQYEEQERFNLNNQSSTSTLPDNLIFYRPVKGIVSSRFNSGEGHYGIDVATTEKESILATMRGIVIFAGFDATGGYVIQLQHPNGFVSIYKHNALLLKRQGDQVVAGEAIALAGSTGSLSTGVHLHFELWYRGYPIDPEEFIAF